jgi:hypothetical protein
MSNILIDWIIYIDKNLSTIEINNFNSFFNIFTSTLNSKLKEINDNELKDEIKKNIEKIKEIKNKNFN